MLGLVLALAAATIVEPAAGSSGATTSIEAPACPTPEQFYPEKASQANVSGRVVLNCEIKADGTYQDCRVVSETPPNWGFGAAALCLTPRFHKSGPSGSWTPGARVEFPINFKPPED